MENLPRTVNTIISAGELAISIPHPEPFQTAAHYPSWFGACSRILHHVHVGMHLVVYASLIGLLQLKYQSKKESAFETHTFFMILSVAAIIIFALTLLDFGLYKREFRHKAVIFSLRSPNDKAPEAIIKKLESIRRRFFWGESGQNRKISWIGWKQVLNSYEKGGLNIGSLRALNLALLGKWWWRFYKEKDALWRNSVTAIHGTNGNLGGRDRHGIWGTISKIQKYLNLGIVDFRNLFYEDDTGVGWGLEDDVVFSVSSLRRLLDDYSLDCSGEVTHWFKAGPRKAKVLLWRVARDRLPTRDNLMHRGIFVPSSSCPLCNLHNETVKHIFFDCNFSMTVRFMIKSWYQDFCDSEADVDGIARRVKAHKGNSKSIAEIVHLAYFWVLWGYRNDLMHLSSTKCAAEILVVIKNVSLNWVRGRVTSCRNITWDRWTCCPKLACNIVSC